MRIVAFSGPKFCGKDTAAKGLFRLNDGHKKYLFRRAPMAEGVKNVCREAFGYTDEHLEDPVLKETKTDFFPYVEPRWPMMDIANWFRDQYGGNIWVERWQRVTRELDYKYDHNEEGFAPIHSGHACHVMTDLRFPEELEMLKKNDALIIYVHRTEAEEALKLKRGAGNAMALNVSESHYDLIRENATHTVYNDGTIAQLHNEVQCIVRNRFGFWGHWSAREMICGE
jgi:hypothetical protein